MTIPNETDSTTRRAAVYRLYDADGALLYIGSAYDPAHRWEEHLKKPWAAEVAERVERWYPDRSAAYAAETAAMDLSKPAPQSQPLSFKGHLATAVVYPDRVEFRRPLLARLGGNRSGSVLLADVLKVHQVEPTRLVNGHVHLMTAEDPGALQALASSTQQQVAGNPRAIMFAWGQREVFTKFVAAVEAAWRAQRPDVG